MRVLALAFIFLGLMFSCSPKESSATMVTSQEMKELMVLDSVQLIDVRSLEAFREGHLKGAQNLVYDDEFVYKISQLDKNKPVAVYCRTGRRSEKCSSILRDAGFKQIYQLKGGLTQWEFKQELIKDTLPQ
ncbi:rhodanese-like domain-containing protein [Psychroflexus montanilacus]|uniref:rhodanese-like domain-containing protein n=1 Tax=Psychroflexus montanilacus TaxID=2873598 RepID=UPI001CCE5589|nr:rhodanese-like domain-containing protein [Psychroflexus montanilacus]MBZ9650704.1 rhodanese-like domain-containing protein [Psychroflexus montanilacus]